MTALGTDLSITCFGELRIELAGRDVTPELPGRQGRTLFAYLAVTTRPVSRDELIDALWPSHPPAHPEAAFGSVLAKVRRALPDGLIPGRESLALHTPPAALDVLEVRRSVAHAERALEDGDARAALEAGQAGLDVLSRPLLPALSGDWLDAARDEFAVIQLRGLEIVARAGTSLGDAPALAAAERAAEELVERQPFREDCYALLMDAQARRGNSAEALRTFERLRVLLREELGASPSPEVVAVHERVLRGEIRRAAPAVGGGTGNGARLPRARGRPADQRGLLRRARGMPRGSFRPGGTRAEPAGRPSSRSSARPASARPAWRRASRTRSTARAARSSTDGPTRRRCRRTSPSPRRSRTSSPAPAPTSRRRGGRAAVLARLFPGLLSHPGAVAAPVDERDAALQAVRGGRQRCWRARPASWPLLLVLDDLHWADKPTLRLLRHLLRHPEGTRLLVLGA